MGTRSLVSLDPVGTLLHIQPKHLTLERETIWQRVTAHIAAIIVLKSSILMLYIGSVHAEFAATVYYTLQRPASVLQYIYPASIMHYYSLCVQR